MGKQMNQAIKRLREIQKMNRLGGGDKHIERQHGRGKLTARERIECLVDADTFKELGSSVNTTGSRIDGKQSTAPCDGAVTGTGKVNGFGWHVIFGSDSHVLAENSHHLGWCAVSGVNGVGKARDSGEKCGLAPCEEGGDEVC